MAPDRLLIKKDSCIGRLPSSRPPATSIRLARLAASPFTYESLAKRGLFASVFAFLFVLGACGEAQDQPAFPFMARIITSENGEYALRNVTYTSLLDPEIMKGNYGQMRGNASLNVDSNATEVITSTNPDGIYSHRGAEVRTDYLVKEGVIVPRNFQTMEMLSLYFNIERTIDFWADRFSVDFNEIGLPGLFYNPKLSSQEGGVSQEVEAVMNAAYLPGVRDLWFFRTSPQENIPVKMNFSVVAHEFGHFIFDYRFADFDPNSYKADLLGNERLLSGLNEGLADFFAYMVTSAPREFAKSLQKLDSERSLPVTWTFSTLNRSGCKGGFYCEGSILASALFEIASSPGQNALKVGRIVYDVLPEFYEVWSAKKKSETLDYSSFINLMIEASGDEQAIYCSKFKEWFDTEALKSKFTCT